MENISLTNRIVGAIVILSLAIIFIPIFLETNQINPGKMNESPIPEIPSEISTIVFQLNESTGEFEQKDAGADPIKQFNQQVANDIEASKAEVELKLPPAKTAGEEEKPKETAVANTVKSQQEHTWIVQLASFRDQSKAIDLRDQLRRAAYVAYIDERKLEQGSIWRVRVGPVLSKNEAEKIQNEIHRVLKLKGLIVRRR